MPQTPERQTVTIAIVSDIHYACLAEQARRGHEIRAVSNPFLRWSLAFYRHFFWLRDPYGHNDLLDRFLAQTDSAEWVVAVGDYSCDTSFVGVSDDAACTSALECLGKLRAKFPGRTAAVIGDHELGKISLLGGRGGMRLRSWHRASQDLDLKPFWRIEIGSHLLMGVTSSVIALPVFAPETLSEEMPSWEELRKNHLEQVGQAFSELRPDQRVLLFCHDPTALPFLWAEEAVRAKLDQVEQTIIGHFHTPIILWKSRWLSGMPPIGFLGNSVRRMSTALREARHWWPFKVRLCPSLTGCQLLKDGGYCTYEIQLNGSAPGRFRFHPMDW